MGFYERQVLPRVIDVVLSGPDIEQRRAATARGLTGTIVEVGFGSGRNVRHYPPEVHHVWAVDPAVVGRKLAARRVGRSATAVEYVGLDGENLPLDDHSVDHALSTWTLCTIPDVGRALTEIRRVLKPGGSLHFVEHGRSADPDVARWQDRLNPIQNRIAGGCHLNRRIDELIAQAGFRLLQLDHPAVKGPKVMGYLYEGIAVTG
jgi:ubiquinone/menaquinone biosynthesis C-methylase UbiE